MGDARAAQGSRKAERSDPRSLLVNGETHLDEMSQWKSESSQGRLLEIEAGKNLQGPHVSLWWSRVVGSLIIRLSF